MKSTVETVSPTRVRLAVEVPFEELKSSLDKAYKTIGSQVRVPGFRPGKVPARVIDQRVGRAAVLEQVVNDALPQAYSTAVRDAGVKAIGQPDIEVTKLEDNQFIAFTAEVDVRPEFTVPSYDGIAVTVDDAEVTDEQVTEQLDSLRERFGTLTTVERAVQEGDYVAIDLLASVDGVEVDGGSASNISYKVGSGDLVDGLDAVLVGLEKDGAATFSSTLQQGEHAGTEADITVTVNSVKKQDLPDADDDFAQLASEFDTIDELRADLRERMGRVSLLTQGSQARDKVLEQLLESVDLPLPASLVKAEVDWREHDAIHGFDHDEAKFAAALEEQGQTREEFNAEVLTAAEQSVKSQLVLDAIADSEQLAVSDAELTNYLIMQAQRYQMSPQDFANQVMQAGNLPALMADVRRNKALATVLEAAVVTDASGNVIDLNQSADGSDETLDEPETFEVDAALEEDGLDENDTDDSEDTDEAK